MGLTFTQTRATFLEAYEMPSGGDWTLGRYAALVLEAAERVTVAGCNFSAVGGNAVLLSNHVWDARLFSNEVGFAGDSGFVLVGATQLADGSAPSYPNRVELSFNVVHDVGVYGKQTAAVAWAKAANVTVANNVLFNGPRAGLSINDGFSGGSLIQHNLIFNWVRETADHGSVSSWDRTPYWTFSGVDDGFGDPAGRSLIKATDVLARNFVINGYAGAWAYDHDDGSQFINNTQSVLLWGGCKSCKGNSKSCDTNLIVYPGVDGRSTGGKSCQTNYGGVRANAVYYGNRCVATPDAQFFSWGGCDPAHTVNTTVATWDNTHYANASAFVQPCGNATLDWALWQASGQDAGSVLGPPPSVGQLVTMATDLLFGTFAGGAAVA